MKSIAAFAITALFSIVTLANQQATVVDQTITNHRAKVLSTALEEIVAYSDSDSSSVGISVGHTYGRVQKDSDGRIQEGSAWVISHTPTTEGGIKLISLRGYQAQKFINTLARLGFTKCVGNVCMIDVNSIECQTPLDPESDASTRCTIGKFVEQNL